MTANNANATMIIMSESKYCGEEEEEEDEDDPKSPVFCADNSSSPP